MTNINQINDSTHPLAASNAKASKNGETDAFGDALSKAFDKTRVEQMEQTTASALGEIEPGNLNLIHSSDIISGKTDKLLDMLNNYSSQLEDPEVSLKNIAPVLEAINKKAGSLLEETQRLTSSDESLKKIATQTIVAAQTEYLRFQRGDYTS